ncbi:SPOR domain-containing protein [Hydrogenophaga sp. PBL-H3]|uniref:SPOR domain-containing protein n=1 Tax=Hydrogenophaga sp. PBL-H3 TaxID=434010 RepID=UPI0013201D42|nr:SPOR domain-containing protein [Hydrogenophaga sp. PBL-H3]QHE77838.1 SPOR domain-containing protein [Hydrogenophaga sp. PBL-H3]QHE82262.1 SPOR domain-containing protein [Hydrogenophaga sp. PBL-H3]
MTVTPQPASETTTTALYRAALGPVNVGRYLPVFARFDGAGRAGPGWNWAAALLTLNWLVFRQLWGAALMYVAAVEGLALLVLGLSRDWQVSPSLAEWGFLGAIFVLSCLIPGVYGNAWLHADTRRRMTRAVREARTVREACAALAQRSSTRKRLWVLAIINVALAAAALGSYWGLSRWVSDPRPRPVPAVLVPEVAAPPAAPVAGPSAPPAEPLIEAMPAPLTQPTTVAPVPPELSAVVPAPATAPVSVPVRPVPLEGLAINVGLFADAANADRVHARLIDAGLPAYIQVVDSPKGQRTRVRVGPFASRALADEAAGRIRALGLDAVVFRP